MTSQPAYDWCVYEYKKGGGEKEIQGSQRSQYLGDIVKEWLKTVRCATKNSVFRFDIKKQGFSVSKMWVFNHSTTLPLRIYVEMIFFLLSEFLCGNHWGITSNSCVYILKYIRRKKGVASEFRMREKRWCIESFYYIMVTEFIWRMSNVSYSETLQNHRYYFLFPVSRKNIVFRFEVSWIRKSHF